MVRAEAFHHHNPTANVRSLCSYSKAWPKFGANYDPNSTFQLHPMNLNPVVESKKMNSSQKHACSRCRASKLRCLVDTFAEHGKCRRCHNAGAECVFDSRAPRQRRKRTDTRVAALEKEIAGLKAAIGNPAHESSPLASSPDSVWQNDTIVTQYATDEISVGEQPRQPQLGQEATENGYSSDSNETIPGLVDATQLPFQLANTLLTQFIDNVVPQYPVLALGTNHDFSSLRRTHPTLLLAMITSASRGSDPALFRKLHYRLLSHVGHQVLVLGRRSLELVQAILAMEVWYDPPDDMDRLNFYMWIRIAGIMVQQLGLWPWSKTTSPTSLARPSGGSDEKTLSEWRTAFAVFLSNSTVAISLRRPFTLIWSESMSDVLDEFDRSCDHVNDKRLVAWVRLQVIAEEIETLRVRFMGVEERSTGTESPPADRSFMNTLEGKLAEWRYANQSVTNSSLQIHFFYCRTKLYELAVFISQAQTHSLPIFPPRTGDQNHVTPRQANPDMAYIRVVMSLIQSSHSILDTVIHLDIPTYLNCPTVTTVRALYAMQMIFTLYKSVKLQNSHISDLIGEETLVAKFYANQIKDFFERAVGVDHFQVPRMALASLAKVTNYMLLSPSVETQQQDTPYAQVPDSRPGESRDIPPNDMDAILVTEIKSSGPLTQPGTTEPGIDLVSLNQEAAIEASFQPPPLDSCGLAAVGGAGDPSHIWSEFEIMALPSVAIDPSWLFPEEDYDLSHHIE
ncbi:hypothetical protein PV10_02196 [Exophiala mesophila]|uniref:Zn(2)-C6 fungal-type domain-containing protein n=1 Tax=Exophiala mesophila TaxID=212818 RepID=A0A0D1ZKK0_EXOME|nr:uncharacterized protein PV10_02196 [Exophiala mesophila]KIV94429.1 hypothetical protein PV10_02196 [Exophiala mesophila]